MIDKPGKISPNIPSIPNEPSKAPQGDFKKVMEEPVSSTPSTAGPSSGGFFETLRANPADWQKFINNLLRQMLAQIKHDQDRSMKALKNLKNSLKGE